MTNTNPASCPFCNSRKIKKQGRRKNKLQNIQKFRCNDCGKYFTEQKTITNKTYSARTILNAISYYNLGHPQTRVCKLVNQRFKVRVSQRSISEWLEGFKEICTYNKLRKKAVTLYSPKNIIKKQTLYHIQPYTFQYHKAKLYLLFHTRLYNNQFTNTSLLYEPLKVYLEKIPTKKFPHHIFTYNKEANERRKQRASQIRFKRLKIKVTTKNNQALKLAQLALKLAENNKQRHEAVQNFMLINDSTTIAVEVPVYLTNWDSDYYRNQRGFLFPLKNHQTPITGHIDVLQIRNGLIHILDYKPSADKVRPIEQLSIYALAISRKLNLPLYYFKCAWFDDKNYYEFFPLHCVYKKKGIRRRKHALQT